MKILKTAALIAALAAPATAQDMTAAEREAFRAEVRAYLLENPEVLIEAMDILRGREAEADARADTELLASLAETVYNDGVSWVGGNPDGDITIVEFLDYRCGYCRRAHSDVQALLAEDGNIRWVVKEFPILGEASDASAKFALATLKVLGDDAYGRLHDVLMTFEGPVTDATLPLIAKRAEIDLDAVLPEMESDAVADHIDSVRLLAQQLRVTGTPAFVIGGSMVRGYVPKDAMSQIVAEERDKSAG
ncbi:MAG: DsbA family protein [Pseudomonadota bacterium]